MITRPRPPVKSSKPKPFSCSIVSLTIAISDVRYSVDAIPAGELGSKAFRLTKHAADGAVYDVVHDAHGCVACDCPSYEMTHRGTASTCKHGRALVELGLMPAPAAPVAAPSVPAAPAPCCPPAEPEPCSTCIESAPTVDAAPLAMCVCDDCVSPPFADQDGPEPADDAPQVEPTADDAADYRDSTQRTDARLTLVELIDLHAAAFRSWGNPAGEMFAGALDKLALQARLTEARTTAELADRIEVLDDDVRRQWEDVGRASCEPAGTAWGHMA